MALETEDERAEVLRLLHKDVRELTVKLERQHTELMGALNARDAMLKLLETAAVEATKWRAVEALAFALPSTTADEAAKWKTVEAMALALSERGR